MTPSDFRIADVAIFELDFGVQHILKTTIATPEEYERFLDQSTHVKGISSIKPKPRDIEYAVEAIQRDLASRFKPYRPLVHFRHFGSNAHSSGKGQK